ncbi:GNAT family N-acetyltransferase [Paracoccus sp. WLY502]|uniref:GNAT family N-acetyltransferase n=1 Tax=Paracoccus yibinensis TaxID=3068891 RepID=UPI00279655AB|nr:GNAT family N-acetyltransferase [Paracoccus sp. WLY502]MDQ1902718.1 GNAT family N-acetyltransferase [Paracoccus sp. WLY502]
MQQTKDLKLCCIRKADVAALFSFLGNAAAMRFTHVDRSLRECRRRVMVHEYFRRRDGCAPWVVRERCTDRIIGWGGLYQDPFELGWGFEVGYFFHPEAWGKGYASQLVSAALAVADDQLNLPEVWAMAHTENWASQRVLEKAGFVHARPLPERKRMLYRRSRL